MSRLVVINLGSGSLSHGFPQVTAQIWTTGFSLPEQVVGSLPPAPALIELYQNWRSVYCSLCNRHALRSSALLEDDVLEIAEVGVTNVSQNGFNQLCQRLCIELNAWLTTRDFLRVERQLRSHLHPTEEIRIILETKDEWLQRMPLHQWEFFQDYPKASLALSQLEYKRRPAQQQGISRPITRILAILGNSQGIDLEAEAQFLKRLWDAETTFLVQPSRQEFNEHLWSKQGWDILFFAGHSQTEGKTGRLYINENPTNNSITIDQLEEALKASIEQGLQFALFNSCDGLGLAFALERLNIPVTMVMREPVPNRVAQEFFKYFLEAFAIERLPFYQAMRQSSRKLQGLEDEFPGASWLPAIYQNPATEPPTWLEISGVVHAPPQTQEEPKLAERFSGRSVVENPPVAGPAVSKSFIRECEQALLEAIGPIARFLIQDVLTTSPQITEAELVERLSDSIPNLRKRTEFTQRFLP